MTSFVDDNGNELQYEGKDFALTKQVVSLFDLTIRANTSVNITIPATAVNRGILNFYRFNQQNGKQLVSQTFNLIRNGNKIDRGSIILISDDGDELTVFFASGNFKWFGSLDFKCNEIRTTRWDVRWSNYYIINRYNATEGIIFPFIDWNYRHEKYNKQISLFLKRVGNGSLSNLSNIDSYIPETYPCLYIHTLLSEIANHSQVNISGTLLDDVFFKKLIITPAGPKFTDPTTGTPVFRLAATGLPFDVTNTVGDVTAGPLIKPEMIAPSMKAIDFIKCLSAMFGCIVSFDETKNTINIDLLTRLNKSEAEDWSAYYISHEEEYKDIKRNNYIKYNTSDDEDIISYNKLNDIDFGSVNIESGRDDDSERTIYTMPFYPSLDKVGTSVLTMATPYVPFITLSDDEVGEYTSVSDVGDAPGTGTDRNLEFNGTDLPFDTAFSDNVIVRIVDDNGLYDGFHTGNNNASASTVYRTSGAFFGTSTGKIYTQSAKRNENKQFILVAVPSVTPADISSSPDFFNGGGISGSLTNIATAYFSKPDIPFASALNVMKKGLSFGSINMQSYNDFSLKDSYLTPLARGIVQPTLRTKMRIPVDVFAKFNGSKLIYLNTGTLNGYFVVKKIEHYNEDAPDCNVYISIFE